MVISCFFGETMGYNHDYGMHEKVEVGRLTGVPALGVPPNLKIKKKMEKFFN